MKNYYEILEVNEKATKEVIEKVYKVLVKKYHPDLNKKQSEKDKLDAKMSEINEAYDVLSNDYLREQFDRELEKERQEKYKQKYGEKTYSTETGVSYKSDATRKREEYYKNHPEKSNNQDTKKSGNKKLIYVIIDNI